MPAVTISPVAQGQLFDDAGNPLAGGKIFTYQGGSFSIPRLTYSNYQGTIANSNPIVLDSDGRLPVTLWLIQGQRYNIVITRPDGTTVLQTFENVKGVESGGGGGGGEPAEPNNSVQFNAGGAFGGSANFLYDDETTTVSLGESETNVLTINGNTATIETVADDITLLPEAVAGYVVVGEVGENGRVEGTAGADLTITSDQQLILESANDDILLTVDVANKVSIAGPTASQYATGLADNDVVNKYYVDNNSGGGPFTISIKDANYTTLLADADVKILTLENPLAGTTTFTIDNTLAYPAGTSLTFLNNSASTLLITCPGASLIKAQLGTGGTSTLQAWGMATAIKVRANYWFITGAGLS